MSFKIKIDLKKQKITSSNMSDNEDSVKTADANVSEIPVTGSTVVSSTPDSTMETDSVDEKLNMVVPDPTAEAVSDGDNRPVIEAVSDVEEPLKMEAVSDDDSPTNESLSDADSPSAMESSQDDLLPEEASSDICLSKDPMSNQTDSLSPIPKTDEANSKSEDCVSPIPKTDEATSESEDCAAPPEDVKLDEIHNQSVHSSSETAECAEELDTNPAVVNKDKESKTVRCEGPDVSVDCSKGDDKESNSENQKEKADGLHVKQGSKTPNVVAEFSDNEDNVELPPQSKLLEVIFKEDEVEEENMDAFIPEVECTVEDGDTPEDKGGDHIKLIIEEVATLTPDKGGSSSEGVGTEENTNDANPENDADDSYMDVTSNYSAECDDETMQTYAKEFLYSDASSLGPELDATGSEDGKRPTSLARFPKIAKSVAAAEYSLLQEMYKLLYLRNPWDTKEVLSARILDFSGFHFALGSEDYFNREVLLRGMQQKTLESIARLLCLARPVSARSNKQRISLATRIMKFLKSPEKPKRNRSATNTAVKVKPAVPPAAGEPIKKAPAGKPGRPRKSVPSRLTPKSSKKEPEVKVKVESVTKKENTLPVPETERNISPGKTKWSHLALPEVKVELTKMQLSDIRKATKSDVRASPVDETSCSDNTSKTSKGDDFDEATDTSNSEFIPNEEIKKLREFPEVLSNIEGTPEKILSDIHYLLYLEDASLKDLKSNVMEYRGFPVDDGPNEVEERKQFLDKMSDDIIKNLANTFYLKCSNDKAENIKLIISFLKAPCKRYMKEVAEAPDKVMYARSTHLMDGLSDSDDSITCEIVQKRVDCIDLISSGEECEKEQEEVPVKKEVPFERPSGRCLHDFETITKIVNTHPHEYLIDIYNLLYQRTCEPSTLRKEILEFTGFGFEKGSDEYVKRKQFLDRMQYNNVRRIFNTIIHNTRDVRVFSKPTMISEIFQFLFKLPDTDTSVRPPLQKTSVVQPVATKEKEKVEVNPALVNVVNKADTPPQAPSNARLSELKRVFQRVACFPCEYLVDVHKLLFMKDCDMKDIRQNIFAFKGFPFAVDSQEFKQRKMYLEYLTFHSLRKISSVLTTKNVDLRNSTKHELSTHLTKVLTEYTNTFMDAEAQEATNQAEEITAQANKAAVDAAQDPNVEKIVVTPVIEGYQAASTNDSTLPKVVDIRSQSKEVSPKSKTKKSPVGSNVVTSSTASKPTSSQPRKKKTPDGSRPITVQTFEKIIIPTVDQPGKQRRRKKANPTQRISEAEALTKAEQMGSAMQFQDIHLPEVESLVRSYQQNPRLLSTLCSRPPLSPPTQPPPPPPVSTVGAVDNIRTTYTPIIERKSGGPNLTSFLGTTQFPLQMLYSQVRQSIPPPNVTVMPPRPAVPFQIIRPFSMQPPVQNLYYSQSIINSSSPPLEPIYKDDEPGDFVGTLPVECILTEGGSGEPAAKKPKLAQLLTAPQGSLTARSILQPTQPVQPMKKSLETSNIESSDSIPKPSTSFHMKIRDAMTKASEDEEDCDKPLATLVGHPNDKVLKQQICEIVENTDLQDITINGVIQKIFNMYPKFNLNYRKEFIKSSLRSLLYRLGEQEANKTSESDSTSHNPDSAVSTSDQGDSTKSQVSSSPQVPASWSPASMVNKS